MLCICNNYWSPLTRLTCAHFIFVLFEVLFCTFVGSRFYISPRIVHLFMVLGCRDNLLKYTCTINMMMMMMMTMMMLMAIDSFFGRDENWKNVGDSGYVGTCRKWERKELCLRGDWLSGRGSSLSELSSLATIYVPFRTTMSAEAKRLHWRRQLRSERPLPANGDNICRTARGRREGRMWH